MAEKSIGELVEIADKLMMASVGLGRRLSPVQERKLVDIVSTLSQEDWRRLYSVFVLRHMPGYAAELMSAK